MSKKDWKSKNPFATLTRNFGKQERTDNLDDALQNVSRQLDQMEQACHDVGKKISGCLRTKGMEGDKRFQKLPEWLAGQTMISTSKLTPPLLGGVLGVCGQLYLDFAVQTVTSDEQQEQVSLIPLQNFEKDLQNLHKTRKQFDKLTKDVESSKAKYSTLRQSKGDVPESKLNQCVQELDEAEQKLEQCRVQYSTELYSLLPREAELSNSLMQLMQAQAQYYRTCLDLIDRATQEAQKMMQESEKGCVFGRGLEEHLKATGRDVAFVLEECIGFLLAHLDEEGLFRLAGGAGQVKLIKAALDASSPLSTVDVRDVHCVSSLLKQYLRELPEPLLTFSLYDQWLQAMSLPADQRVTVVKATCDKLPPRCRDNLKYLLQFLVELSQHASRNKMTPMNIGVVIGPCLLWAPGNAADSSAGVAHANGLVETMINSFDSIFPEDMSADNGVKGHSRGSSAGSGIAVSAGPSKSYTDVADWLTKSPQHTALDVTDDDGTSPRNTRTKKQAPMPPQLAAPSADVMTRSMEEPQIRSATAGRGAPPQRPDKPARAVDKATGPSLSLATSSADKTATAQLVPMVTNFERRAPRASMDEFDTSDCDMSRSTDTVGDTFNGPIPPIDEADRGDVSSSVADRLPQVADRPGKPQVPNRPSESNMRSKPSYKGPPTVADALAAAGNEAMKKFANKPERPAEKPQMAESSTLDKTKTKSERLDKAPQEIHATLEQTSGDEPKVAKVPPVKPDRPLKPKVAEKNESAESNAKKPDAAPKIEGRSESVPSEIMKVMEAPNNNGDAGEADVEVKVKAATLPGVNKPQRPAPPPLSQPPKEATPSLPSPDSESTHL